MEKMIADAAEVSVLLDKLAHDIVQQHPDNASYCLVGIKTRGAHIARRLQQRIEQLTGSVVQMAELDISFYRDDLTLVAQDPLLKSTSLGLDIAGKTVILADDVLYSGRTILCALNALAGFGRAKKTEFLTLVDRGHHCLPVCADFVGLYVATAFDDIIHVHLKEKDGDDCIMHNIGGQHIQ